MVVATTTTELRSLLLQFRLCYFNPNKWVTHSVWLLLFVTRIGDLDPEVLNPNRLLTPEGAKPGQLMPFGTGARWEGVYGVLGGVGGGDSLNLGFHGWNISYCCKWLKT